MAEFVSMIKGHKNLVKVKFESSKGCDHSAFKKEVDFFVKKIKKTHKTMDKIDDRRESCTTDHLFKGLLAMIEDRDEHQKMPVRKFFNNTFDASINDAIFALMKRQ